MVISSRAAGPAIAQGKIWELSVANHVLLHYTLGNRITSAADLHLVLIPFTGIIRLSRAVGRAGVRPIPIYFENGNGDRPSGVDRSEQESEDRALTLRLKHRECETPRPRSNRQSTSFLPDFSHDSPASAVDEFH